MGANLGELKLLLNSVVGTSETNLMTNEQRRIAINRAVETIVEQFDIPAYTDDIQIAFNNGLGNLPDDCLRPLYMIDSQKNEYTEVDYERFGDEEYYDYKIKYNSTLQIEQIYTYPTYSQTLTLFYIVKPTELVNDTDQVRFKSWWNDAIVEKAAEILFTNVRNYNAAQAKRQNADDYIAKAWQNDRQRIVGRRDQHLTSIYSRKHMFRDIFTQTTNQTTVANIVQWIDINSNIDAQSFYGYNVKNDATRVFINLPLTSAMGDIIEIAGIGLGGWRLTQNAGQQIKMFNGTETTIGTGGYIESNNAGDSLVLECLTNNTTWKILNSQGNIIII